jgi:mevalonate kinase
MKRFPAKILLFGEYSIITGSKGLALPFELYGGNLAFPGEKMNPSEKEVADTSNRQLTELTDYLDTKQADSQFFDIVALRKDLAKGLYFQSNIPNQYGVGSSGALTAALYHRYGNSVNQEISLLEMRQEMAVIESFYHGTSSGLDPLVAYVQKPVWIESAERISTVAGWPEKFLDEYAVFLIDSGQPGGTSNLVNWFVEQHQQSDFRNVYQDELVDNIDLLIEDLMNDRSDRIHSAMQRISSFQLRHFHPMIPIGFRKHFQHGLESGDFTLKLCGSGGGGYLLGFTKNRVVTEDYFREREINCLFIEMVPESVDEREL